ncbi:Putative PD-(D/E)XK nuclease [Colletotrichum destructivum]|uniref:PD-(D/E)XK nuclease n=1 Tax=Colletotrichum destructivum TaxID=34406 RepID=A0AAX4J4M6_9PEZI|nr:Putative PD-(D/E)XK nuclease [Colletotrichum destructivum]
MASKHMADVSHLQLKVRHWLANLPPPSSSSASPTLDNPPRDDTSCKSERDGSSHVSTHPGTQTRRPVKRRRLLTPPRTAGMSTPSAKHSLSRAASSLSNATSSAQDNDQTPKRIKTAPVLGPFGAPPPPSSRRSGSVSPKKQARNTTTTSIQCRQYDVTQNIPGALKKIWRDMSGYSKGIGVVGFEAKAAVENAMESQPRFQQEVIHDFVFEPAPPTPPISTTTGRDAGPRTKLGPTPTVDDVLRIFEDASMCYNKALDEPSWNQAVHSPVLSMATKPIWRLRPGDVVAHVPCTTATIMPVYAEPRGRKVDYCMCIQPDPLSAAAIRAIRDQDVWTNLSINHTEFNALQDMPIAVSIETKPQSGDEADAQGQLAVWQAAQWRLLERLVGRNEPKMPLPDFLPGIVVIGHAWHFVASTKQDADVTLWTGQTIGSTDHVIGIYQIACALQYLARWVEETYWPWYKGAVLQLPAQATQEDGHGS